RLNLLAGCATMCVALVGACQRADVGMTTLAPRVVARTTSAPAPLSTPTPAPAPLKLPLVAPRIIINKGRRELALYSAGRLVKTYRVALGLSPADDKERQCDRRTPEGEFYVCAKNAQSQFYLSLGLSYPNAEDATRGLRSGLITQAQHDRIVRAIRRRRQPPWDTALGGEVMLHGGGTDSDWTWGCIALANADIKELFDNIPNGTTVIIEH
ncbi:MAG TPA: L,D-transpeptidase family protein, partial [Pyrinomonadaceae bacterium]|nr:L,D-transpeptidase family protein [Pyrinomonadaceae bacterium]